MTSPTHYLSQRFPSQRPARNRKGATLLDVATGSMLLAVLLIPSIHLIGEARSVHHRLDLHDAIVFEATELIESTRVAYSDPAAFQDVFVASLDRSQTIPISDGPDLLGRVRVEADKSLPGATLLEIIVDVWHDADSDARMGSTEARQTLRTQWASP